MARCQSRAAKQRLHATHLQLRLCLFSRKKDCSSRAPGAEAREVNEIFTIISECISLRYASRLKYPKDLDSQSTNAQRVECVTCVCL
jgi:hypothetical protein